MKDFVKFSPDLSEIVDTDISEKDGIRIFQEYDSSSIKMLAITEKTID